MAKWCIALGVILFAFGVSSYVYPEFLAVAFCLFLVAVLMLLLVIASIVGAMKWRKHTKGWFVPALVCLASLLLWWRVASPLGQLVSDRMFERNLADYSAIVSKFRSGDLKCSDDCEGKRSPINLMSHVPRVFDVWATHCNDGGVVVLFRLDTDVPLLHEGYVLKDYGEAGDCNRLYGWRESPSEELPFIRHVEGNWYRWADQPGF